MAQALGKARRFEVLMALLQLLVGAVILSFGITQLTDALRVIVFNDRQVDGVASEVWQSCTRNGGCTSSAMVEYTVSGVDYVNQVDVPNGVATGDVVTITYDPARPEAGNAWIGTAIWRGVGGTFLGLVFGIAGITSLRSDSRGEST